MGVAILTAALTTFLTLVTLWLFMCVATRDPEVEDGVAVLRHGWGVTVLALVCLALGVPMLVLPPLGGMQGEPVIVLLVVGGIGVAFLLGGLWFLSVSRWETVRLTTDGIEGQSGFERRRTALRWSEIERVHFSGLTGYLTLIGPRRQRVRVSALLRGSTDLVAVVERQLRVEGLEKAVRKFRTYRSAYGRGALLKR